MTKALNIAIITVSDTRDESNDTSGLYLAKAVDAAGHTIADKQIVKDDIYQLRAIVSKYIADDTVHVIISTGGTGFMSRDSTPEAITPLFDKKVDGFGELFRQISYDEIGTSTIQSRVFAGLANQTLIFCLPGSTSACQTGWSIIQPQLDANNKPCNFVTMLSAKKS
ncbi:molybdenum cofactor biosynthesis protein B [Ningiella sp. W23]|uniref:molybdenum cofactor biosynthesis protein B n=1 Tax=Ningiella sp. W23 TaxID=3023715 RepID=UPI003757B91E